MSKNPRLASFSFTYRKNVKADVFPTVKDYDICYETLKILGNITASVFEKDSKGKLHLHGVVEMPLGTPAYKFTVKGYSSKFKVIYNLEGWMAYISKDQTLANHLRHDLFALEMDEQFDFKKNLMPRRSEARPPMDAKKLFIEDDKLFPIQACPDDAHDPYSDIEMERRIAD